MTATPRVANYILEGKMGGEEMRVDIEGEREGGRMERKKVEVGDGFSLKGTYWISSNSPTLR